MEQRNAVQPLLNALDEFFKVVRPIDNITAVVFDDNSVVSVPGYNVHARTFQSNNVKELGDFFRESFYKRLTKRTYLYDSMLLGLNVISKMPSDSNKFLLVFTDGEDINSSISMDKLEATARAVPNLSAYAVDFTEKPSTDFFLNTFTRTNNGRIWKAESSAELLPILQAFSDTLTQQYIVSYRLLTPPQVTVALEPKTIVIEEVTTIDSSPLLNYVFFERGESEIPDQYVLLSSAAEQKEFSEEKLDSALEKYRSVLNILGKRLVENPGAQITITGCNSNQGQERDNIALSRSRAEAVQRYLEYVWQIDPSRMEVKARNLPEIPSATRTPEGIAENQRVEIFSDHYAVLDIVRSRYVQNMADPKSLRIMPQIQAEAGIEKWKVKLKGEGGSVLDEESGQGDLSQAVTFNLVPAGLGRIASFETLTASIEVTDKDGETIAKDATADVRFIRRAQQKAQQQGQRMLEKYALILFEFDKAEIKERNKEIIDRIVARMRELPSAEVRIVGHTDTIGKEDYNMELSHRRARAVYDQIMASGIAPVNNITYTGVGPREPLYDNSGPEGRALNRTVTVTLEYRDKTS